jgi:hypothetical protein
MKRFIYPYFLASTLLVGCEARPRLEDVQTINRLTQQVAALTQQAAAQHDSIGYLQEDLAVAEAAVAVHEARLSPAKRAAARALPTTGILYHRPEVTKLRDTEMAEVLSLADSTVSLNAEDYQVRAYRVCNGPADGTLEYCNCSHYVYVATGTYDMPQDYQIFRIGPFYLAEFIAAKGSTKEQPLLAIRHDIRGRKHTDVFRITADGIFSQ